MLSNKSSRSSQRTNGMVWDRWDRRNFLVLKVNSLGSIFDKKFEIPSSEILLDADMRTKGWGFEVINDIFCRKAMRNVFQRQRSPWGFKDDVPSRNLVRSKTPIDKRKRSFVEELNNASAFPISRTLNRRKIRISDRRTWVSISSCFSLFPAVKHYCYWCPFVILWYTTCTLSSVTTPHSVESAVTTPYSVESICSNNSPLGPTEHAQVETHQSSAQRGRKIRQRGQLSPLGSGLSSTTQL
jgi:hypothetical protein